MVEVFRAGTFDRWFRQLKSRTAPQSRACWSGSADLAAGNPGDVEPVGQGVSELRIACGPGYRIYYLHDGDQVIVLLTGGDKSTQDADIRQAHQIAAEWRRGRP